MWGLIKNILWIYGFICKRHRLAWLSVGEEKNAKPNV